MSKSKSKSTSRDKRDESEKESYSKGTRETIESIVVAIILAFLFRAFIAEAFVIPTGSMAPTLQGQHKDVVCHRCKYQYRTGASLENLRGQGFVVAGTCPICRYTMSFAPSRNSNQASFTGDRILVSKFAYDLFDPQRWDVIVFKYPGNAKQNYIKRLIGLPNEIIRIYHGDIYTRKSEDEPFEIARKPAYKQKAMMQLVDDTQHIAPELVAAGWPSRWQPADSANGWTVEDNGAKFTNDGSNPQVGWVWYQHYVPTHDDWSDILAGREFAAPRPQLIADFYAYNAYTRGGEPEQVADNEILGDPPENRYQGIHWVGDLALEADVTVQGDSGELVLEVVEGGVHYRCRIDVATGQATLEIGDSGPFVSVDGQPDTSAWQAKTAVQGKGRYNLRFANADQQLRLWVNNRLVDFSTPTTFDSGPNVKPQWSTQDPGDLAPVRLGSKALALEVDRLRVHRDVYYIAVKDPVYIDTPTTDYEGYESRHMLDQVQDVLSDPTQWDRTPIFDSRREVTFVMGSDDYFPLGDNSPHSKDARLWEGKRLVEGRLLTGKALMIYWPHSWNSPVIFTPNVSRMGFIR